MITQFKLPTAVTYNGLGVNGWIDPDNILLVDNEYAVATSNTNVIQVGNFNLSIPQLSDITNFNIRVKGYRGSFNTTLQIYAVDNTTGVELSYPLTPFQGFSGTNTLYTLPSSLFGTTWTVDQANNIQLKLIADGELHIDSVEISADYVSQVTPVPVPTSTGAVVVDEFVQAQTFELSSSMTDSDLFIFTKSFTLPNGTNIEYADFYGEALITVDQGIPGSEENIEITAVEHNYQGTGLTRLSIGSITNRGLKFIYPYDHDINLCVPHNGNAQFVISNSAPFYNRFLRKNQIDALVSAPIIVNDENTALTDPAHTLDFRGAGVSATNDGVDPFKKIITIAGNGVNPPNVISTASATTGTSQATSLTYSLTSTGINRLILVQISTEATAVSGVTYNGVALTQATTITNGGVKSEQWYLIAPPIGTYSVVITLASASYITSGAEIYNTVNQSSPIGTLQTSTGTSTSPSLTLITATDNSLVVDSLATGVLPIVYTTGAGQVENWHVTATPNVRQGASSIESAGSQPDSVTMSWSLTQSTPWAQTAIEIKGISSVTPVAGQAAIQFEDEGVNLGTSGTVTEVDFTGAGATATRSSNKITIDIPGSGSTSFTVAQTAHGFVVGDVIRPTTTQWTKSLAVKTSNSDLSSEVWAIVTVVPGVNSFTAQPLDGSRITTAGILALMAGYAGGDPLFLSASTAGTFSNVEPAGTTDVSKPIGYVEKNAGGTIIGMLSVNQRGLVLTSGSTATYKNGAGTVLNQVNGTTLVVTHSLGIIPKRIFINGMNFINNGTGQAGTATIGSWDASGQSSVCMTNASSATDVPISDGTYVMIRGTNGAVASGASIGTVTSTQFTLTVTGTGPANAQWVFQWSVEG